MKRPARWLLSGLLIGLAAAPAASQTTDPKTDFTQALARFSLALDGANGDEGAVIAASLEAMARALGEWDNLIRTYETAMAAEVGSAPPDLAARMHVALGGIYLDRGRTADAVRELEAARRIVPSQPQLHTLLAVAYAEAGNDAAATDAAQQASALAPGDPVRTYVLARHLARSGRMDEAQAALRSFLDNERQRVARDGPAAIMAPFIRPGLVPEATGVEPYFPPVLYTDGFALLAAGDYAGAVGRLADAAARDPLAARPVASSEAMGRAATAFRDGQVQTALQHLNVAIELEPDRAEAHRLLGIVYAADQQYDRGVEALRTAVRLEPGDERARLALAAALTDSGQFPEAERVLNECLARLPASGRARYVLARLHQRQGRYAQALREFATTVTLKPLLGLNGIYETMGALKAAQQDFEGAAAEYLRRVDVHPNDAAAHLDLGKTYSRQGRHTEALAEFAVVLMLDPASAAARTAAAQIHLRDGDFAAAADAAQEALERDAEDREARYVLATSLMRLGRTDEGRKELETFQRLQAEDSAARTRLFEREGLKREAAVSAARGDHAGAAALLRKALDLTPQSPAGHLELGIALLDAGQTADAIEHLRTAARLDAHFDVHRYLAEAYAAQGELEASRREQAEYERLKAEVLRRRSAGR